MLPKLLEQSRNGKDVTGGIRIEDDDVVKVGGTLARLLITSLITLTNLPGAAALLPCGMTSHSKRRVGVQNAARGIVCL